MSAPDREEGHPWVGRTVLALAAIAALLLGVGLVRAVAVGEVLAPVEITPRRWLTLLLEGDPAGLLGLGTALLLLLPVVRDMAIALLAARERAFARVALALVGGGALVALYVGLLLR